MIKGIHFVRIAATKSQPVRWYVYAWRGGPRIMVSAGPARPTLDRAALAAYAAATEAAKQVQPDMLASLIRQWCGNPAKPETASPEWRRLAPTTREVWGLALDKIEERWGLLPIQLWNDARMVAKVVEWRDSRAATPRAADMGVTVLAQLLEFARLRAQVTINVAAGVPQIYETEGRADIIWSDDDVDRFMLAALQLNRPHVIDGLWLALLTGMRRSDLVALTWAEVGEHAIVRTARKKSRGRRRRAVIPFIPETVQLLNELRGRDRAADVDTVLVNSLGRPWTPASFGQAFHEVRDRAGIVHPGSAEFRTADRPKHLHDCRGTFVTKLCRCGLTDREIADIVAWSPENVATIRRAYVDDAAVVVALSERIRRAL